MNLNFWWLLLMDCAALDVLPSARMHKTWSLFLLRLLLLLLLLLLDLLLLPLLPQSPPPATADCVLLLCYQMQADEDHSHSKDGHNERGPNGHGHLGYWESSRARGGWCRFEWGRQRCAHVGEGSISRSVYRLWPLYAISTASRKILLTKWMIPTLILYGTDPLATLSCL